MLSIELQAEILASYFGKKHSLRRIARELRINRRTVAAVVDRRAVGMEVKRAPRKTILDPFKPTIEQSLLKDPEIPATTILQKIRKEGYLGSITVLRGFVSAARIDPKPKEAFLTLNFEPGECAQVDWGEFGDVFGDGVKIHGFVMVLCYSRKLYLEFTRREKFEDFIRCHENAFRYFGRVPRECWFDNLSTAVSERMGPLTRFNARFLAYMAHHGITPLACNKAKGNEKGRVEDGVKYIRSSFWAGREFRDFFNINDQALEWRETIANKREHSTTRKIPELVYENIEKGKLLIPNPIPYDTDEVFSKAVPPSFHITYETNQYSVPWTLSQLTVTVRVDEREIKVFYHDKFVTKHERCYRRHQPPFTKDEHKAGLLEVKPNANNNTWQIDAIKSIGQPLDDYMKFLQAGRRSLRHEASKILALTTIYGKQALLQAVKELLELGIVGVDNLELKLRRSTEQINPPPMHFQKEELNRVHPSCDLRQYDAFYFKAKDDGASDESKS